MKKIPANIGEYLKYDETSSTGLRWIKKFCNKINVGDGAGCKNSNHYYVIKFDKKKYFNHRIVFFLHHGYCPDYIDHIDGNRSNNKIENLRECSKKENAYNSKLSKNNKSGHKGVGILHLGNYSYWYVQIKKNGKQYRKCFPIDKFKEACDYADSLRKSLHGDFANNGATKYL